MKLTGIYQACFRMAGTDRSLSSRVTIHAGKTIMPVCWTGYLDRIEKSEAAFCFVEKCRRMVQAFGRSGV